MLECSTFRCAEVRRGIFNRKILTGQKAGKVRKSGLWHMYMPSVANVLIYCRNQGLERVQTLIYWKIKDLRGLDLELLRNQGLEGVKPWLIGKSRSWGELDLDWLRNQGLEGSGPLSIEKSWSWGGLNLDLLRNQGLEGVDLEILRNQGLEGIGPWFVET